MLPWKKTYRATYPEPWHTSLNDLEKMILLKCLRADKVTNSIQIYISKYLGKRFIEPQTSGLDSIYNESSPTTPLIFVLSSGTDPASELYKFAAKLKMARKLHSISLGQGQGPRAELMLRHATEAGNWLFFQVCSYYYALHVTEYIRYDYSRRILFLDNGESEMKASRFHTCRR